LPVAGNQRSQHIGTVADPATGRIVGGIGENDGRRLCRCRNIEHLLQRSRDRPEAKIFTFVPILLCDRLGGLRCGLPVCSGHDGAGRCPRLVGPDIANHKVGIENARLGIECGKAEINRLCRFILCRGAFAGQ
jgi:hypothetical protein